MNELLKQSVLLLTLFKFLLSTIYFIPFEKALFFTFFVTLLFALLLVIDVYDT